jgi:hypothetical protein
MKHPGSNGALLLVLPLLAACAPGEEERQSDAGNDASADAEADADGVSEVPAESEAGTPESVHPLTVVAGTSWDIGSDNDGNLYITWLSGDTIRFAGLVDHAATGEQIAASGVSDSKYCIPRLSVRPDGRSMSIVYVTRDRRSLKHAWRDGDGTWHDEVIAGPFAADDPIYYQAGAAGGDGTVHAVYSRGNTGTTVGHIYYTYKRPGGEWVAPSTFSSEQDNADGARMVVDPDGGIHCTWMPYESHIYYCYAASGGILDLPGSVRVDGSGTMGNGGISVTRSGTVHLSPHYARQIWHTQKPAGGTFSTRISATGGPVDGDGELFNAIGAAERGPVFVSWAETAGDAMSVQLAVLRGDTWASRTVDPEADVGGPAARNMPAIAMTDRACNLLWRHSDGHLYLGEYPVE